jgi:probable rRNA maturation factor
MGWTIEIHHGTLPKEKRISETWVRNIILIVTSEVRLKNGLLSIAFVTKSTIQELNRIYRGKDRPTDVLAFPYEPHALSANQHVYWGEIVICPTMAKKNIPAFGLSYNKEIARLLIHGTLHLAGFDHIKPKDAKIMFGLTDILLKKIRA